MNTPKPRRHYAIRLVTLTALALLTAACGGSRNQNFNDLDRGDLRVINAIGDSPRLNIALENSNFGTATFGQATPFARLITGRYDYDVTSVAADATISELFSNERVRIERDIRHTLILSGSMAAPTRTLVEFDAPTVALDMVEVSVVHAANVSATYDVLLTAPTAVLGTSGEIASLGRGAASGLVTVAAGAYRLRVRAPGSATVIYDSGAFQLVGGGRQLIAIVDYFGPGSAPIRLLRFGTTGAAGFPAEVLPSKLRFANLLTDVNGFDAFATNTTNAGTTTSELAVPAGSLSAGAELPAASYGLSVTMETDPGTEYFALTSGLVAGAEHNLFVTGSFTNATITGRVVRQPQRPISGFAQLNITHALVPTTSLDVYLLGTGETVAGTNPTVAGLDLLSNVSVAAAPGAATLVFTQAGTENPVSDEVAVSLAGGGLYSIFVGEAAGGGLPARLVSGGDFE